MNEAATLDRVVVGAGLCGLAYAWRSVRAGASTCVLEASPRVGGVLRTERIGPWRVEWAAAAFPSTAEKLLEIHAGLPDAPVIRRPDRSTNAQYLWTRSGLEPLPKSARSFFASPLLSPGSKVRLFAELLRGARRSGAPESLYAFVSRRFGRGVAESFLRPMTLGIYGTRPEDLGAADAFPKLPEMERAHGGVLRGFLKHRRRTPTTAGTPRPIREVWVFEEGMEAFPKAIASALGPDVVQTSTPVADLVPVEDSTAVHTTNGACVRAREIVLATTAPEQARLVASICPEAAALLAAVRYIPMIVVSAGLGPDLAPRTPNAFGFLKSKGAPGRILGAAFPSALDPSVAPPGHALWKLFLGGGSDPGVVDLSDEEIRDIVERDLATVLSTRVPLAFFALARWPRAIPVLSIGHRERMARAGALLAPHGIRLSGSHITGVGVHACAAAGT